MAQLGIYAVLDLKAEEIHGGTHLFLFGHDAAAVRMFTDVLADERSMLSRHPEDYNLVRIGDVITRLDQGSDLQLGAIQQLRIETILSGAQWAAIRKQQEPK